MDLLPAKTSVSSLSAPGPEGAVNDAVRRGAASLGLKVQEAGAGLLVERELSAKELDRVCEYPYVDNRTGRPLETYSSLQRRVQGRPGQLQVVRGRWSLAFSGSGGSYRLASRCLVQAGTYWSDSREAVGLQEVAATSTGRQEQEFFVALAAQLNVDPSRIVHEALPDPGGFRESCPLALEITKFPALGAKITLPGEAFRHCGGLAIRRVDIWKRRGIWSPVERRIVAGDGSVLVLETRVAVPPGEDRALRIRADLMAAGQVIASGSEEVEGEADDVNWGDGIALPVPTGVSPDSVRITVN